MPDIVEIEIGPCERGGVSMPILDSDSCSRTHPIVYVVLMLCI